MGQTTEASSVRFSVLGSRFSGSSPQSFSGTVVLASLQPSAPRVQWSASERDRRATSCMISAGDIIQERYRITRPLGSGGFGAVYLAEDQRLARPVAIKEMSEARLDDQERRIAVALFEHEAL